MTLTEFLLARIAEDEADAQRVLAHELTLGEIRPMTFEYHWVMIYGLSHGFHSGAPSPRRVLAECEAARRILELSQHGCGDDYERVQRALALPYANHPDYRKEWRP